MNTAEAASGMSVVHLEEKPATGYDERQQSSSAVETKGFKLRVLASNPVPGSMTSQADIVVIPKDVNDHSPHIRISPDPIEVVEEAESTGQVVGHVMVEDLDSGENGRTRCAFSNWSSVEEEEEDYDEELFNDDDDDDDDYENNDGSDLFRLIKVNDRLYRMVTRRKFDREKRARHKVTLFCWDHGSPRLSTSREITVIVRDINDNRPIFRQRLYEVQVPENNHVGAAAILKVTADDADEGTNANVSYSIRARLPYNHDTDKGRVKEMKPPAKGAKSSLTSATSRGTEEDDDDDDDDVEKLFSIDSDTGIIYAMKSFDYETVRQFHFHVLASDSGHKSESRHDASDTFVVVNIVDVNDEPPLFSSDKHEFFVVENGPAETEVGVVVVTDADASPAFSHYNLTVESSFPPPTSGGSFFHLEDDTGRLVTSRTLDREQYSVHHLWLVVRNTATPHLSSTSHVIVHVTDTNDNAPLIEYPSPDDHSIQVKCSANPGNVVARIRARDADAGENASLEYSVAKGNDAGLVAIDTKTGLVTLARLPLDLLEFKMAADRQNGKRTVEGARISNWTSGVEMKFEVVFVVRDQGQPPKSAETRLEILINCTLADLQRRTGKDTKSDDLLNFLVNTAGFQTDSFKKILTNELIVAIFGAVLAVLLVATTMVVCVRIRRSSRSNHRSLDRNNSKSGLSDSDFKLNISNKMTSQMTSPAENHYHVTPGATRLIAGKSELLSSVKEDNIKNEMLLMNRSKIDDDVSKMEVKGYDYHSSQTLEKNRQGNGIKSFSVRRSDYGGDDDDDDGDDDDGDDDDGDDDDDDDYDDEGSDDALNSTPLSIVQHPLFARSPH